MTTETTTDTDLSYDEKIKYIKEIQTARCRGWGYFLGSYLTGPIWPGIIANRTGEWSPFWVGLGVGIVSLPLVVLDLGIISSIPAAATGTVMMASKSMDKRRKLNVLSPEQADIMLVSKF